MNDLGGGYRFAALAVTWALAGMAFTVGCGGTGGGKSGDAGTIGTSDPGGGAPGGGAGGGGAGGSGTGGSSTDRCRGCVSSADCSSNFCNRVGSNDLATLIGTTPKPSGRCSSPGDTGQCGCFTGFISSGQVCVGTGCSGRPVELCDNLSGDEFAGTTAGTGGTGVVTGTGGTGVVTGIGGSGAVAGTGGSAGAGGSAQACVAPTGPLVADFSGGTNVLGDSSGVSGAIYVFGSGIASDTSTQALVVTGNLSTFGGYGLAFPTCVDASAYSGISFTIGGNVGSAGTMTFHVGTRSDTPTSIGGPGTCVFASDATEFTDCVLPSRVVSVSGSAQTVSLSWADLGGGKPVATVDPGGLLGVQWSFSYDPTTYPVSVTVDDVRFW